MEKEMNNCNGPIVKQIPITYKTKNKLYTQQLTTVVHLGLLKGSMELLWTFFRFKTNSVIFSLNDGWCPFEGQLQAAQNFLKKFGPTPASFWFIFVFSNTHHYNFYRRTLIDRISDWQNGDSVDLHWKHLTSDWQKVTSPENFGQSSLRGSSWPKLRSPNGAPAYWQKKVPN